MLGTHRNENAIIVRRRDACGGARERQIAFGQCQHPFGPCARIAGGFSRARKQECSGHADRRLENVGNETGLWLNWRNQFR